MNGRSKSLGEVYESVDTIYPKGSWRKLLAFFGPAYLVSVGYMDPGNWATDIAGGSQFGYQLIWVILMSNIIAILLQSLSSRLGVVYGRDLAQASKETYAPFVNIIFYVLAEIAIAATDLAEVLGMAIGLKLLFHIPLVIGVCLTMLDTFLLLFLINRGMRMLEAFIVALIGIIGIGLIIDVFLAKPSGTDMLSGFVPYLQNSSALYIAIGIIGATVMPHNLYLHSSLVQSRKFEKKDLGIKEAIRFNIFDSVVALNIAFFVNAALLVLAASTFYKAGLFHVAEIQDAYKLLQPLLGTKIAPLLFSIALIASGQSSTITGTLAGQIVMEGYLNIRIQPWIRRMMTRLMAIIPAVLVIIYMGEEYVGKLLILSQVILSLQLGFAVIPLIHFVGDRKKMGKFAINKFMKIISWLIAGIIVVLNGKFVADFLHDWISSSVNKLPIEIFMFPLVIAGGLLLIYITVYPSLKEILTRALRTTHEAPELGDISTKTSFPIIAMALDFSAVDSKVIRYALSLANKESRIIIMHVVESAGALIVGKEIRDYETLADQSILEKYKAVIEANGYETRMGLGFGNPVKVIPKIVNEHEASILVMGSHGHKFFKDLIFGTIVNKIRHKIKCPVFVVR